VDVTPIGDDVVEGQESVILTLVGGRPSDLGYRVGAATGEVDIYDTAPPPGPLVSVQATDPDGVESTPADTITFMVSRTGSTAEALTVPFAVLGSATPTVDYTGIPGFDAQALSGFVTIPAGESSLSVVLTVTDDDLYENDETITL